MRRRRVEVGMAIMADKPIIFLTRRPPEEAPVDLRQFEFIQYDPDRPEVPALTETLSEFGKQTGESGAAPEIDTSDDQTGQLYNGKPIFWNRIGSLFSCARPAVAVLDVFSMDDLRNPLLERAGPAI